MTTSSASGIARLTTANARIAPGDGAPPDVLGNTDEGRAGVEERPAPGDVVDPGRLPRREELSLVDRYVGPVQGGDQRHPQRFRGRDGVDTLDAEVGVQEYGVMPGEDPAQWRRPPGQRVRQHRGPTELGDANRPGSRPGRRRVPTDEQRPKPA